MMSLLSTVLSFLMGGLPKLLDFFQDREDKKHELALARMQNDKELQLMEKGFAAQARVEEIRTDQMQVDASIRQQEATVDHQKALLAHDIAVGKGASLWVTNLRASIRPVVTLIFVLELVIINFAIIWWGWSEGLDFITVASQAFTDDEMIILSSIIAFWFGTQAFSKK
jgi:hypothetical protein